MRAAVVHERGEAPRVEEIDAPRAGAGEVVVTVEAAGLNPVDLSMAAGTYPGQATPVPGGVGREGVGRTDDGRRVYFAGTVAPWGSFAEQVLVRDGEALLDVPEGIDAAVATAFGVAGMAGWLSTRWRGELQPGETVLVLGASGAVGQVAVQAARLGGAGRIVAAARSEAALELARERGAHATVSLAGNLDGLADRLRDAAGGDLDLVVDPLWGAPAAAAIDALGPRGRLVQLGQSAGAEATLRSGWIRGKLADVRGFSNLGAPVTERRAAYAQMLDHVASGELELAVERIPLEDVADAWGRQSRSPNHKLVIVP